MTPTREQLMEALIDCRECLDRAESFLDAVAPNELNGPHYLDGAHELLDEVRKVLDTTSPLVSAPQDPDKPIEGHPTNCLCDGCTCPGCGEKRHDGKCERRKR